MPEKSYVYPQDNPNNPAGKAREGGLELRDYFAGKALVGLLANPSIVAIALARVSDAGREAHRDMAITAYAVADHMLEERE